MLDVRREYKAQSIAWKGIKLRAQIRSCQDLYGWNPQLSAVLQPMIRERIIKLPESTWKMFLTFSIRCFCKYSAAVAARSDWWDPLRVCWTICVNYLWWDNTLANPGVLQVFSWRLHTSPSQPLTRGQGRDRERSFPAVQAAGKRFGDLETEGEQIWLEWGINVVSRDWALSLVRKGSQCLPGQIEEQTHTLLLC